MNRNHILIVLALLIVASGCGDASSEGGSPGQRPGAGHGGGRGSGGMGAPGGGTPAAVPVEVAEVARRGIASYIETNGTLEAEIEVDVVARVQGPIVELLVEEGDDVERGQLLARLEEVEYRTQLEIARVQLNETTLAFDRAKNLQREKLISPETYGQALAAYESAKAQFEASEIQLDYTGIKAPFAGKVIRRYVNFAEQVSLNTPMFRVSDFDPLLCPIRVPERELTRVDVGQRAYLSVEPYPDERFEAEVLRIRPVVDAETGTVHVTLQVRSRGRLSPGMFARVFVETARHADALVVPRAALSLESIGDTVYVAEGETASRREVELGFTEGDYVEIVSGVAEAESVVVVGQDGLTTGTPIRILSPGAPRDSPDSGPPGPGPGAEGRGHRPGFDPSQMTPERLERAKEMMRSRGMTDEQIEQRLRQMRERAASGQ